MRFFIEHDKNGTVKSIAAQSGDSKDAYITLRPRPGHQVSEVDVPHIKDEHDHTHIREIKRDYRVQSHEGKPRLVRK